MTPTQLADEAARLAAHATDLALHTAQYAQTAHGGVVTQTVAAANPFIFLLTVFILACFVGYYVVWNVTPALHSPLMAVTNAISSVIIVGAMLATGLGTTHIAMFFGFVAVTLASVNIFGGFTVTQRMLAMFRKKVK